MSRKYPTAERAAEPVPGSEKHLVSPRLLRPLEHWLRALWRADAHGQRSLFNDQLDSYGPEAHAARKYLVVAHLLAFFSPALKSLRRLEDVFKHPQARRRFGRPRLPKSTVSDAQALCDPTLPVPLIADLKQRVALTPHDPRLDTLTRQLSARDGTFFAVAARVAWAVYNKPHQTHRARKGNVRVDVDFNVLTGVPEQAAVTDGRTPEYQTLSAQVVANRFYVLDRAYHCYQTLADILAAGSDFLVRLRNDMQFQVSADRPLTAAERLADVVRCQTVRVTGWRGRHALGATPLKLVEIRAADGTGLRLLSNRVDVAGVWLGVIYIGVRVGQGGGEAGDFGRGGAVDGRAGRQQQVEARLWLRQSGRPVAVRGGPFWIRVHAQLGQPQGGRVLRGASVPIRCGGRDLLPGGFSDSRAGRAEVSVNNVWLSRSAYGLRRESRRGGRAMANDPNGVAVLTTGPSEVQATLIIAALRQRGIPAWIIGEWTSGFRAEAPGGVWILVRQADFERAQVVLRTVKAQQPGTDRQ